MLRNFEATRCAAPEGRGNSKSSLMKLERGPMVGVNLRADQPPVMSADCSAS
jgi:hypothetical protein